MLITGGLAANQPEGRRRIEAALASGAGAEHFGRMVAALGGPTDLLERPGDRLLDAPVWHEVLAETAGIVQSVDARAVGLAVVALGGGRTRPSDGIDPRVGFSRLAPVGAAVPGQPLAIVHAATEDQAAAGADALRRAYTIGAVAPLPRPAVIELIDESVAS